jgi:hypothetical protein
MFDNIEVSQGWTNIHQNAYLVSQGVEPGDQLTVTVLTPVERIHFGDSEPTKDSGYVRVEQDDSVITQEGVDCWVLGPATLQVEYAP